PGAGAAAPRTGDPDPPGPHLLVLARGQEGYRRLSREIAAAHLAAGEKGVLRYDYDRLTAAAGGHWHILTGCRKGHLRGALAEDLAAGEAGLPRAEAALHELVDRFGPAKVGRASCRERVVIKVEVIALTMRDK